jgi:hypothetical protein
MIVYADDSAASIFNSKKNRSAGGIGKCDY